MQLWVFCAGGNNANALMRAQVHQVGKTGKVVPALSITARHSGRIPPVSVQRPRIYHTAFKPVLPQLHDGLQACSLPL